MKFGIQMFGSRKEWQPDPEKFFETIRSWGYRQLEPCVSFDGGKDADVWGFWKPSDLERWAPVLRELGIEIESAHVFSNDLEAVLPEILRLASVCGIRQFVLKCPEKIEEGVYRAYADTCVRCAKALEQQGVELLFHNGGEEIVGRLCGKTAYEFLLEACGGAVGAQPDVGWLYAGGEDPEAFLWRNEAYIRSIHYKDMDEGRRETSVGKGAVDLTACFQFARAHGIPQIVDMDSCNLQDIQNAANLLKSLTNRRDRTNSVLCTLDVDSGTLKELHRFTGVIEAPNWLQDGQTILFNREGRIYRYLLGRDEIELLDTGECNCCNNDHVPSPDNRYLGVSHSVGSGMASQVYVTAMTGGPAKLVTDKSPSFLHGWSPDGKELAYCAFREGNGERAIDIYAISVEGGKEKRLTDGVGYNDGPEYAPNGEHIWFNSTRSGLMQVWRMNRDGTGITQITDNRANNWFPHVSPDGKRVVYLTFREGELEPHEHLPNMQVQLHMMDYDGGNQRLLLEFFGGQGSINVNSWSPDSRQVALVLYELEHR